MKNITLLILCSSVCLVAHAQGNRWSVSAEGTFAFVNATSPRAPLNDNSFRNAYNAFLRGEYSLGHRLSAIVGIGYMQSREFQTSLALNGPDGLESIQSELTHHYVVAPIGIKYKLGFLFIRPEIGIGINTTNTRLDEYRYHIPPNVFVTHKLKSKENPKHALVNKMTYPLILTIGTEVNISTFSVVIGLQGFYTLNTIGEKYINQRHAYGFGTTVGIKF